ncbi:ADYC domain-containing protein [Cystobacter ferrugineus]|nr:ADYC domain-containing protein [Cystobacter ferrugineus]
MTTHGMETRAVGGRRWSWLLSVALATVASGCWWGVRQPVPGGTETGPLRTCPGGPSCGIRQSLLEQIDENCPTGDCDPGGTGNAKGIYTAEGGNYCFKVQGEPFFCPEAFINTPTGVLLEVRYLNEPLRLVQPRIRGKLAADSKPVEVLAINGDRTELSIKYRVQGETEESIAKGDGLEALILGLDALSTVSGGPSIAYEMRFSAHQPPKPDATTDRVHRYKLEYRDARLRSDWVRHCEADVGGAVVSFLQGQRVSGVNASVKLDSQVTSMGCEQGSLVTCLAWGFTPWDSSTGVRDETRDYVYRSCLQAKRAAYFVGHRDFKSYTKKGTKIEKWDQYASGEGEPVERIEALWSPRGAVCFNPENRRRPDAEAWAGQDPNQLKTYGVGPCTSKDFSTEGKLFTGIPPEALAKP